MEPEKVYFEDLDENVQEVMIDLLVSMVENKLKKQKEGEAQPPAASMANQEKS
ncbi:MAG: hypothetical protein HGA96_05980 [Desulfobulbaceae bacterium]|nr:hypothetical protein [Desulfobulbaceae bacterium]